MIGAAGEYWVVGVDIEQYDEKRPDKYFRGLWQRKTNSSILKAYRSYFSVVASAPIYSTNFTRMVNLYRQKPPFNFSNPLANMGGIIQVTITIALILRFLSTDNNMNIGNKKLIQQLHLYLNYNSNIDDSNKDSLK